MHQITIAPQQRIQQVYTRQLEKLQPVAAERRGAPGQQLGALSNQKTFFVDDGDHCNV